MAGILAGTVEDALVASVNHSPLSSLKNNFTVSSTDKYKNRAVLLSVTLPSSITPSHLTCG